uniref:AlNc14C451G11725 protein n=1 Tax=Albugo laibachii Nc14 TaxID=890382 RepID=F0WZY2_9STRA|nr:AlNc14C451G11725 [Albugo laibachii Nc14]|eukprot:CCA27063.1 AlNc14C451G11725 [Albugo laibachii Nc14]
MNNQTHSCVIEYNFLEGFIDDRFEMATCTFRTRPLTHLLFANLTKRSYFSINENWHFVYLNFLTPTPSTQSTNQGRRCQVGLM